MGLHFDASSIFGVHRALKAGISPNRILLTSQEMKDDFEGISKAGVSMNLCSMTQIKMYGERLPGTKVSIRLNPGFGSGFANKTTTGGPGASFGIWIYDIPEAIVLLKKYNLTVERIHFHVGAGINPDIVLQ